MNERDADKDDFEWRFHMKEWWATPSSLFYGGALAVTAWAWLHGWNDHAFAQALAVWGGAVTGYVLHAAGLKDPLDESKPAQEKEVFVGLASLLAAVLALLAFFALLGYPRVMTVLGPISAAVLVAILVVVFGGTILIFLSRRLRRR